jgi:hypothetical protein
MIRALAVLVVILLVAAPALGQAPADGPGRLMPNRGQQHIEVNTPIPYEEYPPTSGSHWPIVAKWGIYNQEVPAEVYVHNLEHGGVVLLYHCTPGCPDVVRQIEELYPTLPKSKFGHVKVVVSPNGRIKTRFALLAWTRLDEFERFDRERVLRFVRAWQDKGPEDVP